MDKFYVGLFEAMRMEEMFPTQEKIERTSEVKEYRFMTNFNKKQRGIYEKTIMVTNEDVFIKDEAFFGKSHETYLDGYCALWVNKKQGDMSAFWRVFDAINEYYNK